MAERKVTVSPWHFWHRWCPWSEPIQTVIETKLLDAWTGEEIKSGRTQRTIRYQLRNCDVCGKEQMRRVTEGDS